MNHYLKAERVIGNLISKGKTKFILYPFGEQGMMIKRILNDRYGIEEQHIIDNRLALLSKNEKIKPLSALSKLDITDMTVLLTSDNEEIYSEIRFQLMQYVKFEQIVDVFSFSMWFDENVFYEPSEFLGNARVSILEATAREIYFNHIEGAIAECGVYRGEFANYISRFMPDREFYLFDTFEGFDDRDITPQENEISGEFRQKEDFSRTSVEIALSNIAYRANTVVRKGYFPETAAGLEDKRFAFVSLDMDLYKPILAGLEFFYPRLNPGGVIMIDDFRYRDFRGARDAVLKFCKIENIPYVCINHDNRASAVIAKPR